MVKCRGQMLEDDHQIDWEESVVKRTSTKKSQRSIVNSISTRIWISISFRFGTASSAISNHFLHLMHSTVFCLYSFFPGEMCIICLVALHMYCLMKASTAWPKHCNKISLPCEVLLTTLSIVYMHCSVMSIRGNFICHC